jgi:hypothetical protein
MLLSLEAALLRRCTPSYSIRAELAQHAGILDPAEHQVADLLFVAIDRIDRHHVVAHHKLAPGAVIDAAPTVSRAKGALAQAA